MTFATTLFRVAPLCLLAGAAHASPVPASAADPAVAVPPTTYSPAAAYRPAAAEAASPERVWREQNRIVAAQDAMTQAMGGAAHAGHQMHGDAHAGHAPGAQAASTSGCACCKDGMGGCCGMGAMRASAGMEAEGGPQSCAAATPRPAGAGAHQHGAQP
jgi:hypothetical protein